MRLLDRFVQAFGPEPTAADVNKKLKLAMKRVQPPSTCLGAVAFVRPLVSVDLLFSGPECLAAALLHDVSAVN